MEGPGVATWRSAGAAWFETTGFAGLLTMRVGRGCVGNYASCTGDAILPCMDTLDIALRLFLATAAGAAFGLNRDMHDKETGVRTLGLVGLGAALAVMAA